MSDKWQFLRHYKTTLPWVLLVVFVVGVLFAIEHKTPKPIYIEKNNLTSTQFDVVNKVGQSLGNQQFYNADLTKISQTMSKISWVSHAKVSRDWQRGVVVVITPRTAVANFGSEHLLDVAGVPFVPADKTELNNPDFAKLYGSHTHAKEIMQKMYQLNDWFAPLQLSVVDIVLTSRQTWLIKFDSGLRITVDYDHVDEKLFKLSNILKQGKLPIKLTEIAAIDLRYKNGFSISKKFL